MNFLKAYLTLWLLIPSLLFAQNYKPGYVVNVKGDTVKGYIDFKEWSTNPTSFYFKTEGSNSKAQKMTVNEVSYFEIVDFTAYKAFNTSISLNETDLQRLQRYADTTTKTDLVFLKVLQTGKNVSLYSYTDDLKERFYVYDSKSKTLSELIYRIFFVENDKNSVTTKSQDIYKQQLSLIAQQYPSFNENINNMLANANYLSAYLLPIIGKINNSEVQASRRKVNNGKHFDFNVGAGIALNSMSLNGTFPLINPGRSTKSSSPFFSLGVNFYPAPEVRSTVFRLDISYFKSNDKNTGVLYNYPPIVYGTYSFDQSTVALSPQFQFNFYNTQSLKIYVNAGVLFNVSSYTGNSIYNPSTTYTETNFSGLNRTWFSVPLKIGVIINRHFDGSITYIIPNSVSNNAYGRYNSDYNYNFVLQTTKIGLAYIF